VRVLYCPTKWKHAIVGPFNIRCSHTIPNFNVLSGGTPAPITCTLSLKHVCVFYTVQHNEQIAIVAPFNIRYSRTVPNLNVLSGGTPAQIICTLSQYMRNFKGICFCFSTVLRLQCPKQHTLNNKQRTTKALTLILCTLRQYMCTFNVSSVLSRTPIAQAFRMSTSHVCWCAPILFCCACLLCSGTNVLNHKH